ncbi:cellulase family glycosylhydrolase [Paenibacillus sp. MMS18-CY102]|uniref:cellulase family glycosylhydrolase n=1 Tax=Paenibacillus sp. MMS18-CY102 TaxID=2682849 RepID=UPI001365B401|nr:cellulase family glycosylhydrolase [Paenibacillus sp. MMS18-CY102]MWC28622.1 cellulase family glycosylhydrolase [Paenibacillus sp. MMS18-CY102]
MNLNGHEVDGFLKAEGRKLVNGAGQEILLRGVGLGSWLLPEGYMWRFPEAGDRPRRIEKMVHDLIGEGKAKQFWDTYYDVYIAEADIRRIAEEGFNSIRVPINARSLLQDEIGPAFDERHLALIDRVIDWCRTYRLYVVLDLHGAPGGQTGANIDDSLRDQPELFTDEANKRLTVEMWRMLAERYKDEWIVAGYDLLNEPLPEYFAMYNDQIMPLYLDIIRAIREVDDKHMIILEGAHWATDWSIFDKKPDEGNLMLQFHKYWNNPDTASIQKFLDKRDEWNVPIYMGEGGENNIEWYIGAFRLYEDHDISWNFWTWKKLDTINSPCSVNMPEGWDKLVSYLEGGAKPESSEAERILWAYLDNLRIEACTYHSKVVHALLFRPAIRIPAIFYGYRGAGISYGVQQPVSHELGFRSDDGTDIRFTDSQREKPNFHPGRGLAWEADEWLHVRLAPGDWLAYEVNAVSEADYAVTLRAAAPEGHATAEIAIEAEVAGRAELQGNDWQTVTICDVSFSHGNSRIIVRAVEGPLSLEWIAVG